MVNSQSEEFDGWWVVTECAEDLPVDWQPGHPRRFSSRGFAEFRHPRQFDGTWTSTTRINYPFDAKVYADTANDALNAAVDSLKAVINSRKIPR